MDRGSLLEAVELAIANEACINDIIAASYPNGPKQDGTCRDLAVRLNKDESKIVLEKLLEVLKG